jgi:hypothetical protein
MMKIKFTGEERFCIKHQNMQEVCVSGDGTVGHIAALFAPDWGWCEGPFAECAPPELPFDWPFHLEEPGVEELLVMNENADQLLMELEGA